MKKLLIVCLLLILAITAVIGYRKYQKKNQPYLTVVGKIRMADGLGRQSADLIQAMKEEVCVNFIATEKGDLRNVPGDILKIIKKRPSSMGKFIILEDVIWTEKTPNYLKLSENESSIRIAYSMFETDKIPEEWSLLLNLYFDAVVVPDSYYVDVYKKSGVNIPIFELPLGLVMDDFLSAPLKQERNHPLVFANFSGEGFRKNHLVLVRAFAKVFKNNPDVILRINSRFPHTESGKLLRKEIRDLNLQNVHFTELSLERKGYLDLFQSIDCYVNISKGEGFSIQPREAMALGIPSILTDNTAQSTICKTGLVKAISSPILEPAYYDMLQRTSGNFFNCSEEEVANALVDMYVNYESYLAKAQSARKWASQYSFNQLKPLYRSLIKPQSVVLGNENRITEDGIMTTSEKLYQKYIRILDEISE